MSGRATYRSPLRQRQSTATRELILKACVSLLEEGEELTFTAVANRAGVQERTVYRHFPRKDDLEAALWNHIVEHHTGADLSAANEDQLLAAMRRSFAGFQAAAPLIRGMIHSRQGLQIRKAQQEARRKMFARCVLSAWSDVPAEERDRAAAALQVLYSAPAWEALHDFWGMDAGGAADSVELAIRALFSSLRERAVNSFGRDRS